MESIITALTALYEAFGGDPDDVAGINTIAEMITEIADVDFAPDSAVIWTPTIDANWTISVDDGETTS